MLVNCASIRAFIICCAILLPVDLSVELVLPGLSWSSVCSVSDWLITSLLFKSYFFPLPLKTTRHYNAYTIDLKLHYKPNKLNKIKASLAKGFSL